MWGLNDTVFANYLTQGHFGNGLHLIGGKSSRYLAPRHLLKPSALSNFPQTLLFLRSTLKYVQVKQQSLTLPDNF